MNSPKTLGEARDRYLQRSTLKSPHTMDAYRRSIDLFIEFLGDQTQAHGLPLQQHNVVLAEDISLATLTTEDAPIFLHFVEWMLTPTSGRTTRPYKTSTIELRLAGVQRWFQFLDDYGWLPSEFPLAKARRIVRDEMRGVVRQKAPPQSSPYMDELIHYYDDMALPKRLQKPGTSESRIRQWQLTQLRNKTLLTCLAESGGRISEVLSLNIEDFPPRFLDKQEVIRVRVTGKGGHAYFLRFYDALPIIRQYILARGADVRSSGGKTPLFVGHRSPHIGRRITRVTAWRIVEMAARGLGLGSISPHDFRHWRATQLVNAGQPLDVVQDYLGHRTVETTRSYYAHTDPIRVDAAAEQIRLPRLPQDKTE